MSSASSAITYTFVYTDSEPGRVFWGVDEELSDDSPPRVIVYGYDGLPMQPQPLPPVDSPTTESQGYVAESDPKEDPEEYEDDETENGPVDYPMDGGDDDDGDSSGDDVDDEDEDEEEGEEEHLAPVDSAVVIPTVELVSQPGGTEPASIPLPAKAEVERLLAMPTPPPSPLTPLSPPSVEEHLARCTASSAHSSPPLIPSPLLPSSGYPTQIQALRLAFAQALINAVTAALPSPPLYIPPPVDHRDDVLETEMPPHKRLCLFALDAEVRRRGFGEVGYGIRDTWVDPAEAVYEIAPMTLGETEMAELQETDRRRQAQMVEILRAKRDMRREMCDLQAELLALREQPRRARQSGSDARVPDHQDASRDFVANETEKIDKYISGLHDNIFGSVKSSKPKTFNEPIELANEIIDQNSAPMQKGRLTTNKRLTIHPKTTMAINNNPPRGRMSPRQIMAHVTRQGPNALPNDTNPNNMILEFVKFATYTLLDAALTWWNNQIRSLGYDAYVMTWEVLKKKMTDKYCPQGEIKKLEIELWNLKFVANETEKIDKYISGLHDNIFGSVKSSKPKTFNEPIELANEIIDQNSAPMQKGRLTTNKRLTIHPKTTMAINNNPPRGRMSPRSTK
uniref:Retrotransposon gag domain-containing protein n=1 Tax=Tanacetum cinerariifolium TaxID=118510 RepID=A0A699IP31_TANCI|nr:hypothetical protein [Tanacetum cinerariifolium]